MSENKATVNMLKQQIRTWDILDENILNTISTIPREAFVPEQYKKVAYAEMPIPIGHDQVMLPPAVQARILQTLNLRAEDKVLEVGTGTGYLTALLAHNAQHVYSVEIFDDLLQQAEQNLKPFNMDNINLQQGNGATGWSKQQPYDVICVTGSVPVLTEDFRLQLKVGGRLLAIVGTAPVMEALLITRTDEGNWQTQMLFETCVPALVDAPQTEQFQF